jgi:hypothetical protein
MKLAGLAIATVSGEGLTLPKADLEFRISG